MDTFWNVALQFQPEQFLSVCVGIETTLSVSSYIVGIIEIKLK